MMSRSLRPSLEISWPRNGDYAIATVPWSGERRIYAPLRFGGSLPATGS
jgi:hypothetical protein